MSSSWGDALQRSQDEYDARRARVAVTEVTPTRFVVAVDGHPVLLPSGKPKTFRSNYNAKQHGMRVTWNIDDAARYERMQAAAKRLAP